MAEIVWTNRLFGSVSFGLKLRPVSSADSRFQQQQLLKSSAADASDDSRAGSEQLLPPHMKFLYMKSWRLKLEKAGPESSERGEPRQLTAGTKKTNLAKNDQILVVRRLTLQMQ